jgi:O-antigen ligase
MGYALWDIRMKLPLLVLPLLVSLANPLTQGQFRALVGLFIIAVVVAVMWCLQVYWLGSPEIDRDVRSISVFISHVRFSLLIALALALLVRFAHQTAQGRILITLCAIPSLYFIYIIGSITGFVAITALLVWALLRYILQLQSARMRLGGLGALVVLVAALFGFLYGSYARYFDVESQSLTTLESHTTRGEAYDHSLGFPLIENGNYVMTYVARNELNEAWNIRSVVHPDSLDGRGHVLSGTLLRYLASKGLRKDMDGVMALSDEDVRAIEFGIPTCVEPKQIGLQRRLNRIFFEWSNYRAGGDPNGHSVMQRLEFWKTGWWIISENSLTGVGTGDVKDAFKNAYATNNSPLDDAYRLRAHNQYLTMWITYGLFGFCAFLIVTFLPLLSGGARNPLVVIIVMLVALSFLTEDTLESQAGVMFMAFFYVLFTAKRALSLEELRRPKSKVKPLSLDAQEHI